MKKKKFLLTILMIILILIAGVVTLIYLDSSETFRIKKFTFYVPKKYEYKQISNDQFEIKSEDTDAVVEIYVDTIGDVHSQDLIYTVLLKENGIDVYEAQKEKINNTDVLCFKKMDVKELLCYYDAFDDFAYEVTIKNNTDIKKMEEIMKLLEKVKYDYKSDIKFSYYKTFEKLKENLN